MGASGATGLAGYLVKRLLGMLLLLAGVTFVVFGMMYLAPGDVTVMLAASSPSPEQVAAIRREFGRPGSSTACSSAGPRTAISATRGSTGGR